MLSQIDPRKLTPMMQQYYEIKNKFDDSILLFRLGDFYEMFFDDALIASKELEIVLTSRECGLDDKAPMCGIPHHSSASYINKLVDKGYRVALCEQVQDPKEAEGLVKREVVRIISPGMNLEDASNRSHNYLLSIFEGELAVGFSYIDISTGDIKFTEVLKHNKTSQQIIADEISKSSPSEIIINKDCEPNLLVYLSEIKSIFVSTYDTFNKKPQDLIKSLEKHFKKSDLNIIKGKNFALISITALINYVYSYEDLELKHFKAPVYIDNKKYMELDAQARYNLDISINSTHENSLIDLLDQTVTPMGSRLLNTWIENPLVELDEILNRQSLVSEFYDNLDTINEIRFILEKVYDIERILGKLSYARANGRDLNSLKLSISVLPSLISLLEKSNSKTLNSLSIKMDSLEDIYKLIDDSIVEDAPITITEGSLIKFGYSEELDRIRDTSITGQEKLKEYEALQKEETGIKNLKIVYNKNTGYFIDVTKSNLDKIPLEYHKVQTLTNSERFITTELKEIETMIFTSTDDTFTLEESIFNSIKNEIINDASRIQGVCQVIALLDVSSTLGKIAFENNYCKPTFNSEKDLFIKEGRHPMIENFIGKLNFISNDIEFDEDNLIQIITGPNMSGKSTYLRQTALIIVMAQIGSFVPAQSANLSIVDKVFTRIGASDNIIHGDSTFMVEMKEMANIISNASENSLLLLDEVGRGTSTYDGLSIAWSIIEYISKHIKAKTLFATHYQELTILNEKLPNVENFSIQVNEDDNGIIFLYKINKGSSSRSFGIEVAKLAGLPDSVLQRAYTILNSIEANSSFNINEDKLNRQIDFASHQKNSLIKSLKSIDINELTPMDALKKLDSIIQNANMIEDHYD